MGRCGVKAAGAAARRPSLRALSGGTKPWKGRGIVLVSPCLTRAREQPRHLHLPVCRCPHQVCGTTLHHLVLVGGPAAAPPRRTLLQTPISRPWHPPASHCPCRPLPHRSHRTALRRQHQGRGTILVRLILIGPLPHRAALSPPGALLQMRGSKKGTGSGGTEGATSVNIPLLRTQSSEGKFSVSRSRACTQPSVSSTRASSSRRSTGRSRRSTAGRSRRGTYYYYC